MTNDAPPLSSTFAGVLFLQGINDLGTSLLQGPPKNADDLVAAYTEVAARVHAKGVPIYIGP